jgi:DNA-binding CsgD family transcriptional regulator
VKTDRRALFHAFYGRRDELAGLREVVRTARSEQKGAIVLLSGDAGVGKTRLLEELEQDPIVVNSCALRGWAADYISRPYGPIIEALASDGKTPPEVVGALDAPAVDALEPQGDRLRRFGIVEAYLRRRAIKDGLICVALEDMHWSDAASLEFLLYLTRRIQDAAIVVLATYRTPDIESSLDVTAGVMRLYREGARELNVEPLKRTEMLAAIADTIPSGVSVPPAEIDAICDLAEGRPFVAEELLRDAIVRARTEKASRSVVISLRASVLERLVGFDPNEREMLMVGAVAGREFEPELVATVLAARLQDVERTFRRARDAQLVVEDRRTGLIGFRHAITREVLYREMLASERREMHRRISVALDTADDAKQSEVAYHLWAAHASGAVEANEQAGDRAAAIHAYADAARFYEHALELADRTGDAYPRLLQTLAFALCTSGAVARARLCCEQAVESLRGRGLQERALRQMLYVARQYYETGDAESAVATVERVREELRPLGPSALHYAAEVTMTGIISLQGKGVESIRMLDDAAAMHAVKDRIDVCRASINRGLAHTALCEYQWAIAAFQAAIPIAHELDRADLAAHAHGNVGTIACYVGRPRLSLESFERAIAIARERRHLRTLMFLKADFCDTLVLAGDIARSRTVVAEVLESPQASYAAKIMGRVCATRLGSLSLEDALPDGNDLVEQLDAAIEYGEAQTIASVAAAVAEAQVTAGSANVAETVERALQHLETPGLSHRICDYAARVGGVQTVGVARDLLLRATRAGQNPAGEAQLLLFDARLAARRADEGEARSLALRAAEAFRSFPWPVEEAEALEVAGDLEGALAIYKRIGATRPARRLEDALGVRRSPQTRAAGVLSRREEEVCDLLVRGRSYKAIAEELGIGERTVETHAHSVYRKLGVKTRLELVAQRGRAS